jgi:hypothetical protein
MPPVKLEHAVMLALGLAAGCGDKDDDDDGDDTGFGPCLDYPVDTGDTGPCLEPGDDTGPCLDVAEVTAAEAGPELPAEASDSLAGFVDRVLERGVLPDDVAALLEKKKQR